MSIGGIGAGGAGLIQQFQQNLFNKIDANSDGTIDKSELESAVTGAGGSKASADALFAMLDANNSGSVSEQQFEQNLPKPPMSDGMAAQLIGLQAQQDSDSNSALEAVTDLLGASGGGGDSAQDALMDLIDAFGGTSDSSSSSSSSSSTGSDLMAVAMQMMLMSFQQLAGANT